MNFYEDIVGELTQYFQNIDPKIDVNKLIPSPCFTDSELAEFASSDPEWHSRHSANCLLERFLNLKKRQISQIKHHVMYSSEIEDKIRSKFIDDSMLSVINTIKKELEDGTNVNGRLSKLWGKLNTNDGMLNDWGLYHFHLSNEREYPDSTFYKRTGQLLIAYIPQNRTEVYFLDIIDHNDKNAFSKQEYLSIIGNNWPNIIDEHKIQGAISTEMGSITDDERYDLRRVGINYIDTVNGKPIFNPGGGITSAGTSMSCQEMCIQIMKDIKQVKNQCRILQKNFIPNMAPEYINFRLKLINDNFIIFKYPGGKECYKISLRLFF